MKYPYKQKKVNGVKMDEHRWIMQQHLGRKLGRFELVHHINGDKMDNRLENLEVVTPKEHAERHGWQKHPLTKACVYCGEMFTPHPTKRKRAKTCSPECNFALASKRNRDPSGPRSIYRENASPSEKKRRK